jgi:photosystem II stability/assembly factor-like uncharacterized protein
MWGFRSFHVNIKMSKLYLSIKMYAMKKIIALILVLTCSQISNAQWVTQTCTVNNNYIFSIYFTSPNVGYAVGDNLLIKTNDGGANWLNITPPTNYWMTKIVFTDANTGYISARDANIGLILKTTDAGANWTATQVGSTPFTYHGIQFINSTYGYISDVHGTIYRTNNSGNTWTYVGGSWGLSSDNAHFFVDSMTAYVVGANAYGNIRKTINKGSTWINQTTGTAATMNDVYFINANAGWVVGDSGTILKTIDGGSNWIKQTSGTMNNLKSVHFTDASYGVAVGANGTIIKTSNGGTTWNTQVSNTTNLLNSIFLVDNNIGYTVGDGSTIRKTINGGDFPASVSNNILNNKSIMIFPNPSTNQFTISSKENIANIDVLSIQAQVIHSSTINANKTTIDLSTQPAGIYFVTVKTDKGNYTEKIVLEK